MNKQELLNSLNSIRGACTSGSSFQSGVSTGLEIAITEVEKFCETTKAEPLVVPKGLGKWLSEQYLGEEGSLFTIIKKLDDMLVKSEFEDFISNNKKELIEIILGTRGYEVEKEKLYIVQLPTNLEDDLVILDADGDIWKDSWPSRYKMTERRIKEIDERYWPFAKEVAE